MSGSSEFLFPTLERHLKFKFKLWRILKNWLKTIRVLGITYSVSDVTSIFNCVVFPLKHVLFVQLKWNERFDAGFSFSKPFCPLCKETFFPKSANFFTKVPKRPFSQLLSDTSSIWLNFVNSPASAQLCAGYRSVSGRTRRESGRERNKNGRSVGWIGELKRLDRVSERN